MVRDLERDILRQAPRLDVGDVAGMGVVAGAPWLASGAEAGRGTGPQPGGAGVGAGAGTSAGAGAEASAGSGTEAGTSPGSHAQASTGTEADALSSAEPGAAPEDARASAGSGTQAGAGPGVEAGVGASTGTQPTRGPQTGTDPGAEVDTATSATAGAGTTTDGGAQASIGAVRHARTQAYASTNDAARAGTGVGPQAATTSAATQPHGAHQPTPTPTPLNNPRTPNVLSPLTNGAPEDASTLDTSLPSRDPDGRRATSIPPPVGLLPHIGRHPQRNALTQALADTRAGHGALVVISGEPGIGKTRLLAELERLAGEVGVRVLRGRCPETDAAPAFWPWHAVLRNLGTATPTPTPVPTPGQAHATPPTVLGPIPGDPSADAVGFASASAPLRVYESVTRALVTDATANGPVAVVLDDIHWADPSSLHLLGYAAEMRWPGSRCCWRSRCGTTMRGRIPHWTRVWRRWRACIRCGCGCRAWIRPR
ncbi:AAA family ATPase [Yinghuangia aomiensis]